MVTGSINSAFVVIYSHKLVFILPSGPEAAEIGPAQLKISQEHLAFFWGVAPFHSCGLTPLLKVMSSVMVTHEGTERGADAHASFTTFQQTDPAGNTGSTFGGF